MHASVQFLSVNGLSEGLKGFDKAQGRKNGSGNRGG